MRAEKAKGELNEKEIHVFSCMTGQKNLVETRGENNDWWCEAIHIC